MFQIFHNGNQIGTSALENGDPPMGCAEGVFLPCAAFSNFRNSVAPEPDGDVEILRWVGLNVTTEFKQPIECTDVVLFGTKIDGAYEYWVDVIGISEPEYQTLFPERTTNISD